MKIPKTLKIGGHTVPIKILPALPADGYYVHDSSHIELRKELNSSMKEQTLLHEIFHAINSELDHPLMESLSQQLYQVLKDNKLYFDGKDEK